MPSRKSILWFHGIPGSGKSVITATVTRYLLEKYPASTAFFFCDFQQKSSLQWETIARSLLKQLLSHTNQDSIDPFLEKFENPVPPNEVIQILQQLLKRANLCYLILDGLDECEEEDRYKLLRLFQGLLGFGHNQENLKILVASRYSVDISRIMSEQQVQEINVADHIGPDIGKFIEFELQERVQVRRLTVTPNMLEEIGIALAEKADGMHEHTFILRKIYSAINEDALRACLQSLPRGLPETYDRILSRIERFQDFGMARKVFNWVLAASNPLTVEELAEACAFEFGDEQHSDGARRLATDKWKLIFNCNNLVTVDQHGGKDSVRFAHATVLEHLRRKAIVNGNTASQDAACICLVYLNLTDFERQVTQYAPDQSTNTRIQNPKGWIPALISPSQNVSSTALAVERVSRFRNIRKLKPSTAPLPPIDLKDLQTMFSNFRTNPELQVLDKKYKFAEYARQNWIEHCRFFSKANSCWDAVNSGDCTQYFTTSIDLASWEGFKRKISHSRYSELIGFLREELKPRQEILLQYGPYLVDPIGLILVAFHRTNREMRAATASGNYYENSIGGYNSAILMMNIILGSRSDRFAFDLNRPAYCLQDEMGPPKPIPNYLEWALELDFPGAADVLVRHGARVPANIVEKAVRLGASNVVRSYLKARSMKPHLYRDDDKFIPEESLQRFREMVAPSW
ncbi:hypothetical protein TWF106_011127 [Orbilia oligospora]|uniref:NACHT domain-containing protein n=1 Tax=Orbilia oligospora TaxID=2813651 RepID=A0A7C8QEU3_ORBOL|nr:hypothetical protein TWF106_011127 [Orbilia oligospora]KAF3218565.1 hypothetical protein TWF191_008234 [Orbilia oligospora]